MKKFIRLLLLSITVIHVIFNTKVDLYAQNNCREFADNEIRQNIHKYINVVFGEKTPTLQDFINFEGDEAVIEVEEPFEEEECKRRGWDIEFSECINFMRERTEKADRVLSYYYNFLRSLIKKEDRDLVIHEIYRPEQKKEELKVVLVYASIGRTNLQFYHAGDTCGVPLGLVAITKINNKPISEILKKK